MPTSLRPTCSTSHAVIAVSLALVLALAGLSSAAAQEPPFTRGIDRACLAGTQGAAPFADVAPDATHAAAIDCLWVYGITQGRFVDSDQVYQGQQAVTRQQMASFIAQTIDTMTSSVYSLPVTDELPYTDAGEVSEAHARNVARLTAAGIVQGRADGSFRPTDTLDRAQMATFIVQAVEEVTGSTLDRAPVFSDVSGTHQANIEKLASVGITVGTGGGQYSPTAAVTRAAMASFLARTLDLFVAEGLLRATSYDGGTAAATLGLFDIDTGVHDDRDRVTLTLGGDPATAGWRVSYVDEATAFGSGQTIEVAGEEILEVILTGMALPPDLDDDVVPTGTRLQVDGQGIVEVYVGVVYEGQQQLFIGTTGLRSFEVDRLADPQRIYIDVEH